MEQQINNSLYEFTRAGQWVRNPSFEQGVDDINRNFRVMGQLANFHNISSASNELIDALNRLDMACSMESSHHAQMAAVSIKRAKSYVIESLEQVEEVSERKIWNSTSITVRSPLLAKIVCGNDVLCFDYRYYNYSLHLTSLQLGSVSGMRFSGVELKNDKHLDRISFTDRDSVRVRTLNFEYYAQPSDIYCNTDLWGYPRNTKNSEDPYCSFDNAECTRISSLKSVTLSDGGKIQIDYEPNQSVPYLYKGTDFLTDSMPYGGLRLKSLVYHNGNSASDDTVLFRYPLPGIPMYPEITNMEVLQYSGFSDRLTHSRMKFKGLAFLNTGNNGLYYRQVEEIRSGQGKKSYLFHVPFCFMYPSYVHNYPYWLVGLPLSVSEYDEEGHLLRSVHNHYETTFSTPVSKLDLNINESYFSKCPKYFNKMEIYLQLKADENYMDDEYLDDYYRNQQDVLIYRDGSRSYFLNPYNDFYLPNIYPRTIRKSSNAVYTLFYGGMTLLKSQKEYRYASPDSEGELFSTTEYFYDNLARSVRPTRVVRTDASGDRYTEATTRVTEMNVTADTSMAHLVAANMLSLPMKQAYLKNDSLLKETVNVYATVAGNMRQGVVVKARYSYAPQQPFVYRVDTLAPSLFTYGQSNYTLEEGNDYRWNQDILLPSAHRDRSSETAFWYDPNTERTILEVCPIQECEALAVDLHPYIDRITHPRVYYDYLDYQDCFRRIYSVTLAIQAKETDEEFLRFFSMPCYRQYVRLLEIVVHNEREARGELLSLCDSLKSNPDDFNYLRAYNFFLFRKWFPEQEDFILLEELFWQVHGAVHSDLFSDPLFWEFCELTLDCSETGWRVSLGSLESTDLLRLYILCQSDIPELTWEIHHSDGVSDGSVQSVSSLDGILKWTDLDLSSYEGVSQIKISFPFLWNFVDYLVLVPVGVPFRATSYNDDGTVFCTFDQTGRMEVNEYDAAGRLLRVRDRHGRLLESYEHHVVNP